ncbi:hypothetical protein VNO77_03730 [Canavalia gladiata]|uniref:Uncharacterized protein n=1 Tax=Canavalia gladiata TaxID=3824 RepID=A0AAN9N0W9_CANGL
MLQLSPHKPRRSPQVRSMSSKLGPILELSHMFRIIVYDHPWLLHMWWERRGSSIIDRRVMLEAAEGLWKAQDRIKGTNNAEIPVH